MDVNEIRRQRLEWIRDNKFGGVAARLAERIGRSPSQVAQWLSTPEKDGHRAISADTAREIEAKTLVKRFWLDGEGDEQGNDLSPMAKQIGRLFDRIADVPRQNAAFVEIMTVIERASSGPVPRASQSGRPAKSPRTPKT